MNSTLAKALVAILVFASVGSTDDTDRLNKKSELVRQRSKELIDAAAQLQGAGQDDRAKELMDQARELQNALAELTAENKKSDPPTPRAADLPEPRSRPDVAKLLVKLHRRIAELHNGGQRQEAEQLQRSTQDVIALYRAGEYEKVEREVKRLLGVEEPLPEPAAPKPAAPKPAAPRPPAPKPPAPKPPAPKPAAPKPAAPKPAAPKPAAPKPAAPKPAAPKPAAPKPAAPKPAAPKPAATKPHEADTKPRLEAAKKQPAPKKREAPQADSKKQERPVDQRRQAIADAVDLLREAAKSGDVAKIVERAKGIAEAARDGKTSRRESTDQKDDGERSDFSRRLAELNRRIAELHRGGMRDEAMKLQQQVQDVISEFRKGQVDEAVDMIRDMIAETDAPAAAEKRRQKLAEIVGKRNEDAINQAMEAKLNKDADVVLKAAMKKIMAEAQALKANEKQLRAVVERSELELQKLRQELERHRNVAAAERTARVEAVRAMEQRKSDPNRVDRNRADMVDHLVEAAKHLRAVGDTEMAAELEQRAARARASMRTRKPSAVDQRLQKLESQLQRALDRLDKLEKAANPRTRR